MSPVSLHAGRIACRWVRYCTASATVLFIFQPVPTNKRRWIIWVFYRGGVDLSSSSSLCMRLTFDVERPPSKADLTQAERTDLASSGPITRAPSVITLPSLLLHNRSAE